jgi:hypothetical protein
MKRMVLMGVAVIIVAVGGFAAGHFSGPNATPRSGNSSTPTKGLVTSATTTSPTTIATTTSTSANTELPTGKLPTTVESDAAMQAEGNGGPSSTILVPGSCTVVGTTVTAKGTYQDNFVPEVYGRYGDIIVLYLFTAPSPGYASGMQLAVSSLENSPVLGGPTWQVAATFDPSLGQPAKCVVAAQPTHDEQLAP